MSTDAGMPTAETASPAETTPTNEFAPVETGGQQVTQEQGAPAVQEQSETESTPSAEFEAFTLPEGWEIADDDLGAFTDVIKDIEITDGRITQGGAQKLVDLFIGIEQGRNEWLGQQQEAADAARDAQWQEQLANDPDIGGDKFPAAQASIVALEQSGVLSKEFSEYLVESGEVKNPVVIKQLASLGALLKEDPTRMGNATTAGADGRSKAQKMFANSGHE